MIPLPEKPMLTAHADINDFIIKTYKYLKQLAEDLNISLPAYSDTPQRIGTWVDGTPIWRQAFEVKIADVFDNTEDFETALSDGFISIGGRVDLGIVSPNVSTALVNASTIFTSSLVVKSSIDDAMLPFGNGESWGNVDIILTDYVKDTLTMVGYSGLTDEGIYGYIDFATPESNIMTGDADV